MEEKSEMLTEDNGSITEEAESTLNTSDFESTIESTFSQRSEDDESDHEPDEDGVFNYLTGGDEFPEHENPVLKPPYKTFKPPFTFSEAMKFTPSKQIYLSHVDQRDFVFWKILVFMYEYPPHVFTEVGEFLLNRTFIFIQGKSTISERSDTSEHQETQQVCRQAARSSREISEKERCDVESYRNEPRFQGKRALR